MLIKHRDQDELTVLTIQGELTADHTDRLRKVAIERMEAHIRDFVLDLSRTAFIDSKGLETLLWLQEECVDRLGQVRLAALPKNLETILRITRLAGRFETAESVEAAIGSLRC